MNYAPTMTKMYKIYNNIEEKIVFNGNKREFIDFMFLILKENYDVNNFTLENTQDCIDYINGFCDNIEVEAKNV